MTQTGKRLRPVNGRYPGGVEIMDSVGGHGKIAVAMFCKDLSAEQAREIAHLLNQCAEYLDALDS